MDYQIKFLFIFYSFRTPPPPPSFEYDNFYSTKPIEIICTWDRGGKKSNLIWLLHMRIHYLYIHNGTKKLPCFCNCISWDYLWLFFFKFFFSIFVCVHWLVEHACINRLRFPQPPFMWQKQSNLPNNISLNFELFTICWLIQFVFARTTHA